MMPSNPNQSAAFKQCFEGLRRILGAYEPHLVVVVDTSDQFYLDTDHIMKNRKPLFFGAVWIKKAYVSYHLFPVYMYPDLLDSISPALKKRMQGKSCFNFKRVEPELLAELEELTKIGFERIQAEGFLYGA